jgi:hypothetical protein
VAQAPAECGTVNSWTSGDPGRRAIQWICIRCCPLICEPQHPYCIAT